MRKCLGTILAGALITFWGDAGAAEQAHALAATPCGSMVVGDSFESGKMFPVGSPQANEYLRDLRERMADPKKLAAMRNRFKRSQLQRFPGLVQVMGLDRDEEAKFLDALADLEIERNVAVLEAADCVGASPPPARLMQQSADVVTRRAQAIRAAVGPLKFDRYLDYGAMAREYLDAYSVDLKLAPADKLTSAQRARLIEFLHDRISTEAEAGPVIIAPIVTDANEPARSPEELRKAMVLPSLASRAESLRRAQEYDAALDRNAALILTRPQLAALRAIRARRSEADRDEFDRWLKREGVTRAEVEATVAARRQALARIDVNYEISVTVNGASAAKVTYAGPNGEPHIFSAGEELLVELTPFQSEDGQLYVNLVFYERAEHGNRQVGSMLSSVAAVDSGGTRRGMGGGMVVGGNKGYAIEVRLTAPS